MGAPPDRHCQSPFAMRSAVLNSLDQKHRTAAKTVLEGFSERLRLAYFSGSLAAGLGHTTSDLDVHVVVRDGHALDQHTFVVDGLRVQLTPLPMERLARLAEITREFVATKNDRTQAELDRRVLWDVMRVVSSELVFADDETAGLFHAIDRDVARKILMSNFAHPVARLGEDAVGLAGAGDLHSAYVCGTLALQSGIQVAVAGSGDLYYQEKFLFARIRRTPLAAHFHLLWELMYGLGDRDPTDDDVVRRFQAANALAASGLLDGWDSPSTEPPSMVVGGPGPTRSPFWSVMRFADSVALAGAGEPLRISPDVARLWVSLNGRPLAEVTDDLRARGINVPTDVVYRTVQRLTRAGAVRPPSEDSR